MFLLGLGMLMTPSLVFFLVSVVAVFFERVQEISICVTVILLARSDTQPLIIDIPRPAGNLQGQDMRPEVAPHIIDFIE